MPVAAASSAAKASAVTTLAADATAPIDRSISPRIMTNVIAKAAMPNTATWRPILIR